MISIRRAASGGCGPAGRLGQRRVRASRVLRAMASAPRGTEIAALIGSVPRPRAGRRQARRGGAARAARRGRVPRHAVGIAGGAGARAGRRGWSRRPRRSREAHGLRDGSTCKIVNLREELARWYRSLGYEAIATAPYTAPAGQEALPLRRDAANASARAPRPPDIILGHVEARRPAPVRICLWQRAGVPGRADGRRAARGRHVQRRLGGHRRQQQRHHLRPDRRRLDDRDLHNRSEEGGTVQVFGCSSQTGSSTPVSPGTYDMTFQLVGQNSLDLGDAPPQMGVVISEGGNTRLSSLTFMVDADRRPRAPLDTLRPGGNCGSGSDAGNIDAMTIELDDGSGTCVPAVFDIEPAGSSYTVDCSGSAAIAPCIEHDQTLTTTGLTSGPLPDPRQRRRGLGSRLLDEQRLVHRAAARQQTSAASRPSRSARALPAASDRIDCAGDHRPPLPAEPPRHLLQPVRGARRSSRRVLGKAPFECDGRGDRARVARGLPRGRAGGVGAGVRRRRPRRRAVRRQGQRHAADGLPRGARRLLRRRLEQARAARAPRRFRRAADRAVGRVRADGGREPGGVLLPARQLHGDDHRRARHAGAEGALRAAHARPALGRDDGAHRARRRQRRRRRHDAGRRHVAGDEWHLEGVKRFITNGDFDHPENIVHMVLARPEGAGPGHEGPVDVHRAEVLGRGRRLARRAQRRRRHEGRAQDGHQAARRPASSRSATARRAAACSLGDVHDGIAQMFHVIEYARMARRHEVDGDAVDRVPQRARLRARAQAGRGPREAGRQGRAARRDHPPPRRAPHADAAEGVRRGPARDGAVDRARPGPGRARAAATATPRRGSSTRSTT